MMWVGQQREELNIRLEWKEMIQRDSLFILTEWVQEFGGSRTSSDTSETADVI